MRKYFHTAIYRVLSIFVPISLLDIFLKAQYQRILSQPTGVRESAKLDDLVVLRELIYTARSNHLAEIQFFGDTIITVNVGEKVGGDLYFGLGFENNEFDIVKKLVAVSDIFVDVGANIGLYSIFASRLVGNSGSVHAFEPLRDAFELLERNVRLNKITNVHLNPAALGEREGDVELFINQESALTSLGQTGRGSVVDVEKVPIWTLDAYATKVGLNKIDFLKIDVEGFEGHVLRGAAELLEASPDLVVMSELAKKNFVPLGFSIKVVLDWMYAHGFEIWMIGNNDLVLYPTQLDAEEFPYQNFLFIRPGSKKYNFIKEYFAVS